MTTLAADRIERPPTLFDFVEGPPAAPAPARKEPAPAPAPEQAAEAEAGTTAGGAARVHDGVGGESSLDGLVVGAWEGLTAQAAVACPLCEGTLRPVYAGASAADPVVGGRCDSCGTMIS